jgi:Spx/MgsR family transcriptional regulator
MSGITLFGIKNCDTVKKARTWLDAHHIEYRFHDFRSEGLDQELAKQWIGELGLDVVVNKRGTTWKQLDVATRDQLSVDNAPALLQEKPTLVKRPVLDIGHQRFVGFDDKTWQTIFKKHTL